ncbi:HAMP domain-containing sensor histidine kinase [uncultured Ruegeria sp.]|uniref:sensor histidine kinase n=1 Tax=uncultured Ruegeria sp. TaxID=259304 RepID=UPI00261E6A95|nr:HAMP domain-containing sensor histidine kinase [uncultured Ruegeria sp.]
MSLDINLTWLRRSSTVRLALVLSVIFAIGMAVAVFTALTIGSGAFERRVDGTLQALASSSDLQGARGDSFGLILRAADDLGDLPRPFGRAAGRGGGTVDLEDDFRNAETWRVLVSTDGQGLPVVVSVPLDDGEDALELLSSVLWTTVAVVIALSLIVGLTAGVLGRRRLKLINETLSALASGDLAARTGITLSNDDLGDMARQVDVTAGELEQLVAQTRHLSASLAHDLRTPLARLRSRLEVLPESEERGAALEEAERLSTVFDTIMRVARIEAAQGTDGFEDVALGAFAEELLEIFGPVVEDAEKKLTLEIAQPGTVFADRQMLVQAAANLIQNAIRHGGPDVTLNVDGQSFGVTDNGPGVDASDFAEIIKPMVRLDASRQTEGVGLGLALVRAVANRHQAELVLAPHQPQGLAVTLEFADL